MGPAPNVDMEESRGEGRHPMSCLAPRRHPLELLHCERSSGQYLFDVLVDAGAEFGLEIAGCVTFSG